ncbi:MAG TPA: fumarylacetoacetate hydrolase family protein [Bacillota bacterium]|jgi:2-keto-4-pentenoate hydratase/2-oxohepta-3-ene-1,7-dioic acid hydratase in catechol pathway
MKLATINRGTGTFVVASSRKGLVDLAGLARRGGIPLPAGFSPPAPDPVAIAADEEFVLAAGRLLAELDDAGFRELAVPVGYAKRIPVRRPGKVVAMVRNYAAHAAERGRAVPEEPIYFAKATSSLIADGEAILLPDGIGRVDPEGELVAVIGRTARRVPAHRAMDHVVGYTIMNDVSAREIQWADSGRSWPWFRGKGLDTFGPLGPYLVTKDEVANPHALRLRLIVNGEVRQGATTGAMVHRIPQIIEAVSNLMTLEPGDLIATGTPEGIAPILPGDTVEVEIEGLGVLRNPVRADPTGRIGPTKGE